MQKCINEQKDKEAQELNPNILVIILLERLLKNGVINFSTYQKSREELEKNV